MHTYDSEKYSLSIPTSDLSLSEPNFTEDTRVFTNVTDDKRTKKISNIGKRENRYNSRKQRDRNLYDVSTKQGDQLTRPNGRERLLESLKFEQGYQSNSSCFPVKKKRSRIFDLIYSGLNSCRGSTRGPSCMQSMRNTMHPLNPNVEVDLYDNTGMEVMTTT